MVMLELAYAMIVNKKDMQIVFVLNVLKEFEQMPLLYPIGRRL